MSTLLNKELKMINVGLDRFYNDLKSLNVNIVSVDFKPPRVILNQELKKAVEKLDRHKRKIEKANSIAIKRIFEGEVYLVGISKAIEVVPGMREDLLLHSGPPIKFENMCGPMRGALIGALIYEGKAKTPKEAIKLLESRAIKFSPCHHHNCVGPMAGVISPSMPVWILENIKHKNFSYTNLNEGLGKVLRYGAYSEDVIERLKWMEIILYPTLKKTIEKIKRINLKNIISQALHMGDELHNRNKAANSLFLRAIAPHVSGNNSGEVLKFIDSNDHFFLNLSMAYSKALLDAASGIKYSSLVTVMSRNGVDFGIKISAFPDKWFTSPAGIPDGLFFPGYSKSDANPDIGDSCITETAGLGGFAIACAPAIVSFVGGKAEDAFKFSEEMYEITIAENPFFTVPYFNFKGTPTGIDAIKVVKKNVTPIIDTGIAHKQPGIGQIGAGIVRAPVEIFEKACIELAKSI